MLNPVYSGQFKRDLKAAKKRGKDMEKIKQPMRLLLEGQPLPAESAQGGMAQLPRCPHRTGLAAHLQDRW